jgi:hypothetical protein
MKMNRAALTRFLFIEEDLDCVCKLRHTLLEEATLLSIKSVSIVTGYGLDGRGKIFLSSTAPRPALGPTQPPVHWVLGGDFLRGTAAGA